MAQEAINLTRALKGDNKTQGNSGEVVLTRVLEAPVCVKGMNEEARSASKMTPARGCSRMSSCGCQGKDVVIDAKMTLVWPVTLLTPKTTTPAKARYRNIASVRNHMPCWDAKIINSCRGCELWITC
ncbi:DNA recombination protein RmuC [Escherichia coli]